MPRGNKRTASGSTGPARRSSRTPAKPEPEPVKKTRGASTGDASPAKSARKASPSPAPTSRGRSTKASTPKAAAKTPLKGQGTGDAESKGRNTRAVIKEKEEEKTQPSRGRSTTRRGNKAEEPIPEPKETKTSRSKSSGTPKKGKATPKKSATPKAGRGRSAKGRGKQEEEVEDEEEDEPEEEEEEEPPKKAAAKSTPKGRSKTPAKSKAKAKTPSPAKKATPKPATSRSKSRGGKKEEVSPQVVLQKMDTSDYESPEKTGDVEEKTTDATAEPEVKSPRGRQARKAVVKATPSPRPARSRRSVQKDEEKTEEEAVDMPEESEKVEETTAVTVKVDEEAPAVTVKLDEGTPIVSVNIDENTPAVSVEVDEENPSITVKVDEETPAISVTADDKTPVISVKTDDETPVVSILADEEAPVISVKVDEETPVISVKAAEETPVISVQVDDETPAISVKVDENKEAMEITEEESGKDEAAVEEGPEEKESVGVPVVNVDIATDAVDISDEETSSVVVEPALSVQISDDSESVPADDEPAVVKVTTVIPIDPEPVVPVQNSVSEEPEAMETAEATENNTGTIVEQAQVVDGEQNGDTECRKRKLDEVEEIEDDGIALKKACVSEEVVEQIQENGETTQSVEDSSVKVSTTQFLGDVTTHTPEEEFVMVNMEEVPANNSKEILESLPQTPQTIESVKTNCDKLGPLLNRKVILNPSFTEGDPAKQFSVASYNILAQCHLERNDYSFSAAEHLTLEHRHQKMMREFQFLDADVVCLQEVGPSYFTNTLEPAMKSMGYTGVMKKRTQEYFDEGEATFWKDSRFTLVHSDTLSVARLSDKEVEDAGLDDDIKNAVKKYLDMPDVLILTQLRCNFTNNCVTVGNIHVQWGKMEVPDIQCIQIACAIKALVNLAGSDTNSHVLCGDFNSEVTSPGYQLVLDGYLSDEMIDRLQSLENLQLPDGSKKALFNQLYRAFQHPSSSIKSSYLTVQEKEPTVTSYNRVMRAAVDYIFYSSNSLDVKGVLEVAPESTITETGGIPDATFPSDHVSIKSILSFK